MTSQASALPARSRLRIAPTAAIAMRRRIVRLAAVSAVALGLIWWLAVERTTAPAAAIWALLAGWLLMPAVLVASLAIPAASRLLIVPSTLVTLPVAAIALMPWSPDGIVRASWAAVAIGLLLGGGLGLWLWLGAFPAPEPLRDPRAPLRWVLIVIHVAPIVVGLTLLATT